MAIYVDRMDRMAGGRRFVAHMIADDSAELFAMARRIGLNPKWVQRQGTPHEHFDLMPRRLQAALAAGAKSVSSRELVTIIRTKRQAAQGEDV